MPFSPSSQSLNQRPLSAIHPWSGLLRARGQCLFPACPLRVKGSVERFYPTFDRNQPIDKLNRVIDTELPLNLTDQPTDQPG